MTDTESPWVDRSDEIDEWANAFANAFAELEDITKTRKAEVEMNKGGKYTYKYADLGDALATARPVLAKHHLAVQQPVASHGSHIAVWTTLLHSSGQYVTFTPLEMAAGNTPQTAGSAITYARRYALMAALGLATDDDDGAAATDAVKRQQQADRDAQATTAASAKPPELLTARQVTSAWERYTADGASTEDVAEWVSRATEGRTAVLEEVYGHELSALRVERQRWLDMAAAAGNEEPFDTPLPLEPEAAR